MSRPPKPRPVIGAKIHSWTVVGEARPLGTGHSKVRCRCTCGAESEVNLSALQLGKSRQCRVCSCRASAKARRTLGVDIVGSRANRRVYDIWKAIKARTEDQSTAKYKWYGARGIRCEFVDFLSFYRHVISLPGHDTAGLWLDRVNNNQGYKEGNLRWVTPEEQQENKRNSRVVTYLGNDMALSAFARLHCPGLAYGVVYYRLMRCGWSPDQVVQLAAEPIAQRAAP